MNNSFSFILYYIKNMFKQLTNKTSLVVLRFGLSTVAIGTISITYILSYLGLITGIISLDYTLTQI